jgi:hypothetical protein
MKRHILSRALTLGLSASALFFLASCETLDSRISQHPDIYQSLSPSDQALVSQGKIRSGMSQSAVWLAWGDPQQKAAGAMRGRSTETWIYVNYATYDYPYYGPYGPRFGYGFVGASRFHHHRGFAFFGDPFYDPFYYSQIPPSIPYPIKTVTFANGRVMSFQYMVPPHG